MEERGSAAAAGWITFAGVVMITVGIFQSLAGIMAVAKDDVLVKTPDYLFQLDTTTWGWIHLVIGIVLLAAGFGVFSGNVLARTVGVFVAVLSAVSAFLWLPWYPIWGVIIIAIDVAVIWALTAHGRDLAEG